MNKNGNCEAQEKKESFIRKKKLGAFLAFKMLLGAPAKMLGAPSSTPTKAMAARLDMVAAAATT